MYSLTDFSLRDMTACGAELRQLGHGAANMEEVANRVVHYFYTQFHNDAGESGAAMVRFFITIPYHELNPDLQQHVNGFLGYKPTDNALKCQTLLATIGDNPDWHSRHNSRYYKVHPLTVEMAEQNPMFTQVSDIFGIVLEKAATPASDLLIDLEQKTYNIFLVPNALDNFYVPDQDDFVIPYGIKSVLGFFGMLPSGNLFTVIMFTKVKMTREVTDYFRTLALNVKMAVLPFDETAVFNTNPPPQAKPAQELAQFRSQSASLSQLLNVHEHVVEAQAKRLEQVVTELESQLAENARLRELAAETAVIEERRRLARDLHDSVTQALYSQTLYAEAATRQLDSGKADRAADHLRQLKQTAQQALREMRLFIFELRPPALESEGLVAALRTRLEAVEARTGVETAVSVPDDLHLTPDVETGLYWISQEALNNALKYAQANHIHITLTQDASQTILQIEDNGVGFETAVSLPKSTLGLRSMQERADKLGWQLSINSTPTIGTIIQVEVPHE